MDDFIQVLLKPRTSEVEVLDTDGNEKVANDLKDKGTFDSKSTEDGNLSLGEVATLFGNQVNYGEISFTEVDERIERLKEDTLIQETLEKGIDLRVYASKTEVELVDAEAQLVTEFTRLMPNILNLNKNIENCDKILSKMEALLLGFKENLSHLNQSINDLQLQSKTINYKLDNRTEVHNRLKKSINYLSIDPESIKAIMKGDVNENFMKHVLELELKMRFVQQKMNSKKANQVKAMKEISPDLERLRFKVSYIIRQYLLSQFKQIENNDTLNFLLHEFQASNLLPWKKLNHFLIDWHVAVALEVIQHYENHARNYYSALHETHLKALLKNIVSIGDKNSLIGIDENAKSNLIDFNLFGMNRTNYDDRVNIYQLGDRIRVLEFNEFSSSQLIIKDKLEGIFKDFNLSLSASLISEWYFLMGFVKEHSTNFNELDRSSIMKSIFEALLKKIIAQFKNVFENSFDILGLLLCIRLNQQFKNELIQRLSVGYIDLNYFIIIERILWPRFQYLMNLHINSLKKSTYLNQLNSNDIVVHPTTKRYSDLVVGLLKLTVGHDDPMILNGIHRLKGEYLLNLDKVCIKMKEKSQLIFKILNLEFILRHLEEADLIAMEGEPLLVKEKFELALNQYVNLALIQVFGNLLSIVEKDEEMEGNTQATPSITQLGEISNHFNGQWKVALSQFQNTAHRAFEKNPQCIPHLVHAYFANLLLIYTKFLAILDRLDTSTRLTPVPVHVLLAEFRRVRVGWGSAR